MVQLSLTSAIVSKFVYFF